MSFVGELEAAGVVGWINTPVHDVYRKARLLATGERDVTLGLGELLPTSESEIRAILGRLSGRALPPEGSRDDRSWVDPGIFEEQAAEAGERLRTACEREQRVMFGTGHPSGPLELYMRLAEEMGRRGARVAELGEGGTFAIPGSSGPLAVRYVGSVACLNRGGDLLHTHNHEPMEHLLDHGPLPDLVVGDHGFAGVPLARGAEAVAVIDTNDPALVLAWGRGLPVWPLLCDDNRLPRDYRPLERALVAALD